MRTSLLAIDDRPYLAWIGFHHEYSRWSSWPRGVAPSAI